MRRIVLDTNWWISFIISKHTAGLPAFFFDDFVFCFSNELAKEIKDVLQYEHIRKRINPINLTAYLFFEKNIAHFVSVINDVIICRDKKDNFLLSLSRDGNAEFLIKRDEDLLVLKEFEGTKILTLKEFMENVK